LAEGVFSLGFLFPREVKEMSPAMRRSLRELLRTFLIAFLGSATTLLIGGQFFIETNIEGVTVPDWSLFDEFLISASIAGMIAAMNFLIVMLEGNPPDQDGGNS
jgi:hypothetical protein